MDKEINWHEHYKYDETSPSCLRWNRMAANNRVKVGDVAGHMSKCKKRGARYYKVGLGNKTYKVSRIVWELHNSKITSGIQVDHINGNSLDNRICNLRLVDNKTNSHNRKMNSTNCSGVTGVYLKDNGTGRLYWTAGWSGIDGKTKSKSYSIDLFGYEAAYALACSKREEEIELLNNSGMGYTERHGTLNESNRNQTYLC